MAYTPPSTVTGSDVLTASLWNVQVKDNFAYLKALADTAPLGVVAKSTATNTLAIANTAINDIPGLSVTWTATATRLYLVQIVFSTFNTGVWHSQSVYLRDGSNNTKSVWAASISGNEYMAYSPFFYESGLTGSVTRKASIQVTAGTLNVLAASTATGTYPQIIVTDVGLA